MSGKKGQKRKRRVMEGVVSGEERPGMLPSCLRRVAGATNAQMETLTLIASLIQTWMIKWDGQKNSERASVERRG